MKNNIEKAIPLFMFLSFIQLDFISCTFTPHPFMFLVQYYCSINCSIYIQFILRKDKLCSL